MGLFDRPEPKPDTTDKDTLDTAWRIHGALVDWTGKVDAKASFAFALESAGLGVIVTLSGRDRLFEKLEGDCVKYFWPRKGS